ncbi:MAG: hypothetical protein B6D55_04750 [Candidatus Omnitrophica bacterium 4484_70.2]|nr:MAG: hypothetical protein B6D55_04750 [Candidatus Omnitrophica bacterium 4484_70.2]
MEKNNKNCAELLIGTPFFYEKSYCLSEFLNSVDKSSYKDFLHLIVDNSPETKEISIPSSKQRKIIRLFQKNGHFNSRLAIYLSYSLIWQYFKAYPFKYLLFLEADVIIEDWHIAKIVNYCRKIEDKAVISALIYRPIGNYYAIYKDQKFKYEDGVIKAIREPYNNEEIKKQILWIKAGVFGMLLIPKEVIEDLEISWNDKYFNHPDVLFFEKCNKKDIPVYVITSIRPKHLQRPWKEISW